MPIADPGNPNAAQITLTFAGFVENNSPPPASGAPAGPFCQTTSLALLRLNGQLVDASGQVTLDGLKIKVQRNARGNGNQPIRISLVVAGPGGLYQPAAMVFKQETGSDDADGRINFPSANRNPQDQAITISNLMVSRGNGASAPRWSFYIQIQRSGEGAQPFGWIDPDIENES